jgi:hypothetical protein
MTNTTTLPSPSKSHATCAWCRTDFPTINALLSHVDQGHLPSSECRAIVVAA